MFDLEQSIADWRRQMLAAGIKIPVPLEELEIHLREEIARQIKSELNEQEAFNSAVQKLGSAHTVQNEFKKVEKNHKIIWATMLIVGWLVASYTLLHSIAGLDDNWNWASLSFKARWNLEAVLEILGILVAVVGIRFLAKTSRDWASRVVSLPVCLCLAWFAYSNLAPPEVLDFLRRGVSPFWFRGGLTLLLCLPSVFWVWWTWRHLVEKRHSTKGRQYV